jgi:hypothetical protein
MPGRDGCLVRDVYSRAGSRRVNVLVLEIVAVTSALAICALAVALWRGPRK